MPLPLVFRRRVGSDMAGGYGWYEEQRVGLGEEFVVAVDAAFDAIQEFPEMFAREPVNPTKWSLLALLAGALVASCVRPPYPEEMLLQHSPTIAILIGLPILCRRWPLSDGAFACIVGFMALHTLGARYIYSNVPYDRWASSLFGFDLSSTFGWRRNHYDRLVHFFFGLLWVLPVFEVSVRFLGIPRRIAFLTTLSFLLAFSALYELFEWGLTMVLSPQDAGAYNGEQGDMWDSQKDVALALLGSLIGVITLSIKKGLDRTA